MAEMNGLELLNEIKAKFPTTIVILMTAYGTIQNAVAAMKAGAYDYVTKPFSLDQIQHAVDRALEVKELRTEVRALRNSIEGVPLLTTGSPSISLPYRDGFRCRVERCDDPAHWRKRHRQERSRTADPRMEFTPRSPVRHRQLHHAFGASAGKRALRTHEGFLYRCDQRQARPPGGGKWRVGVPGRNRGAIALLAIQIPAFSGG